MSPDPTPDYEEIERKAWRANAREVTSRLLEENPDLMKRISTFLHRFGYSRKKVEKKILNDPMFAAHFAKEPRRTGLHQNEAARWLKKLDAVSEFQELPASGKDLGRLSRGELGLYCLHGHRMPLPQLVQQLG